MRPGPAAIGLGLAAGGFFDGVLLHQILGWHHLLSAIRSQDLRFQIAWDGGFHALMYAIALVAGAALWRGRSEIAGRRLAGLLLIGFGVWHGLDAVLSHWLFGVHRVRMDVAAPLAWDLGWLAAFGAAPALLGGWLLRRRGPPGPGDGRLVASVLVGAGMLGLAGLGGSGAGDPGRAVVLVASPEALAGVLGRTDSRLIWTDASGRVAGIATNASAPGLYAAGALMVGGAGGPAGCFTPAS